MTRASALAILICIILYMAISLDHLDVFPPVGQDEPWIAAAPYKLATEGVFGSDLFAGYYGVERHNYQHMPLFPLLQALVFRIAGAGVFQMRLLPVVFGACLLAAIYAAGGQVGGAGTGFLGLALLLALRLGGAHDETGIPLLDSARINRYDIAVPVFGLLAYWLFNHSEEHPNSRAFLAVGFLVGLSGLSHLYGLFWLPTLWILGLYRHGRQFWRHHAPYLMGAGAGLAFLPWLLFIASGWEDIQGQMRFMADRFEVFNPGFYAANLIHEIDRYGGVALRDPEGRLYIQHLGAWLAIAGIPAAFALLVWQGWKQKDRRAGGLALAFAVQHLLFAAMLKVKSEHYLIALWPLSILLLARLGMWLWQRSRQRWVQGVLMALMILVLVEGAGRVVHRRHIAARTTPYAQMSAQIAEVIPPGSRVLGLQHYWLGLRAYPFRTWLLPVFYARPETHTPALAMDDALARVDPDVILLDRHMQAYLAELTDAGHADHALYAGYERFMAARKATLVAIIEDATYGPLSIYTLADGTLATERRPGRRAP